MQRRSSVSHVSYFQIGTTSPDPRWPKSKSSELCPKAAAAVPWSRSQSTAWQRACRRAFRRARRQMSCGPPKIRGEKCGLRRLRTLILAQHRVCICACYTILLASAKKRTCSSPCTSLCLSFSSSATREAQALAQHQVAKEL